MFNIINFSCSKCKHLSQFSYSQNDQRNYTLLLAFFAVGCKFMKPFILNLFVEGTCVIYLSWLKHLTVKRADQCLTDFVPVFSVNFEHFSNKSITNFELICYNKIGRYLFKVHNKDITAIVTYCLQLFSLSDNLRFLLSRILKFWNLEQILFHFI